MSNFQTLTKDYRDYAKLASSAESLIYTDPRSSLTVFGTFGEQLTKEILHLDNLVDWDLNQKQRIEKLALSKNEYPAVVLTALNDIRRKRNSAAHDDQFIATKSDALEIDKKAYLVWKWFLEVYSLDQVPDYVKPTDQRVILKNQEAKIKALEEKGEYRLYRYDSGVAYDTAKALAMRFVDKGYHAKFNHFVESWKGYQCVVISKKPIIDHIGCKLYAEHLG